MSDSRLDSIADALTQLYQVLVTTVVPNLKTVQDNQTEQRQQSEWTMQSLDEFRL